MIVATTYLKRNDMDSSIPAQRKYNRLGGRPGLTVDFEAVCDAVLRARNGSGETITEVAAKFGVSPRGVGFTNGYTRPSKPRKRPIGNR